MGATLAVLLSLLCASAPAAQAEVIAVHPLVVVGSADTDEEEAFRSIFVAEVAKLGLAASDSRRVAQFLAGQPGTSCAGRQQCLADLARSTGATRALLVSVSPYSPKLILTGSVVGADGSLLRSIPSAEFKKGGATTLAEAIREAVRNVLADLGFPSWPPPQPSGSSASVAASPAVAPAAALPSQAHLQSAAPGQSWRTPAGIGLAVVGAGALVFGAVLQVQAGTSWAEYNSYFAGPKLPSPDDVPRLAALRAQAQQQQQQSLLAFGLGALGTAGGAWLVFTDSAPGPRTALGLSLAPGAVGAYARFP